MYPNGGIIWDVDPEEVGVEEIIVQPRLQGVAECKVLLDSLDHTPNLNRKNNGF